MPVNLATAEFARENAHQFQLALNLMLQTLPRDERLTIDELKTEVERVLKQAYQVIGDCEMHLGQFINEYVEGKITE